MVSARDPIYPGPNLLNNSRRLMTKDHWLHCNPAFTAHHVVVGAAKPDGCDPNKQLSRTWRVKSDLLDYQR